MGSTVSHIQYDWCPYKRGTLGHRHTGGTPIAGLREKMGVSTPGSQSSPETSTPEVWVLKSYSQNGGISVCCLSLEVCDTLWWQPWKTNVVTVISQIILQNERFLKCFKMFSDLNMDEYILLLLEKIRCETASIHHHFWCSYRTPDRWVENRNLNLDLFMFYSCDNISIAKFKKLIKNGTVGGNIL